MEEIWKPLDGIQQVYGQFLISNYGRIRRIKKTSNHQRTEFLKTRTNKTGYVYVQFWYERKNHPMRLHRLVALHFCDNPNGYEEVNHKDGNKENNRAENLEWCSRSQNVKHSYDTGLKKPHTWSVEERKKAAEYSMIRWHKHTINSK